MCISLYADRIHLVFLCSLLELGTWTVQLIDNVAVYLIFTDDENRLLGDANKCNALRYHLCIGWLVVSENRDYAIFRT